MKKVFWAVLAVILCCLSVSCTNKKNSNLIVNCTSSQSSHCFSSKYDLFIGKREYIIKVDQAPVEVNVNITTKSGSLALTVAKEDRGADYTGNDLPTSHFSIILSESGIYTVSVKAERHEGSYSFDWETLQDAE